MNLSDNCIIPTSPNTGNAADLLVIMVPILLAVAAIVLVGSFLLVRTNCRRYGRIGFLVFSVGFTLLASGLVFTVNTSA